VILDKITINYERSMMMLKTVGKRCERKQNMTEK